MSTRGMEIALRRVLVPTDFSDTSRVALRYGIALVEQFNASLYLLHVVETVAGAFIRPPAAGPREELDQAVTAQAWEELNSLVASDCREGLEVKLAVEWGRPFVEIIRYGRANQIDLIAMGTHGRGRVAHLLLGSVAENVVRGAPCPVLTVRHPEHEFVLP